MQNQSDHLPFELFDPDRAYRISDIARDPHMPESGKLPMAKSAIWKAIKEGNFPKPTKLNSRTSIFFGRDLNSYLEKKYQQSSDDTGRDCYD